MLHKVVCENCRNSKEPPNFGVYKIPISREVYFRRKKSKQQGGDCRTELSGGVFRRRGIAILHNREIFSCAARRKILNRVYKVPCFCRYL